MVFSKGDFVFIEMFGILRQGTVLRSGETHVEFFVEGYPSILLTAPRSQVSRQIKINEPAAGPSLTALLIDIHTARRHGRDTVTVDADDLELLVKETERSRAEGVLILCGECTERKGFGVYHQGTPCLDPGT